MIIKVVILPKVDYLSRSPSKA